MVIARYGLATIIGAAVTFALFYLMQYLIISADRSLNEEAKGYMVDFVQVEREEVVQRKKPKPKKPPPPEAPPPEPPAPKLDDAKPDVDTIEVSSVPVSTEIEMSAGGFSLNTGEGEYLPLVKIQPIYPRRALERGISGYVIVEFTVTKQGTVKDVRVVESDPASNIFHRAAVQAAQKFKYKPRIVDGQPIDVPGVRNKITFIIEK